jgi:ABC-type branched-subunit amino acid transport system substrate-binding protein
MIFRNAFTSQMQVQRLVEIAMDDLHMSRFALLFPNDAYGTEYANIFWDEVKARGGAIVGAQPYDPKARDFRPYVQRLAGVFYIEDRYEEYKLALRKWQQKNPKRSARNAGPSFEDLIGPAADFDAVFVADGSDSARLIAPALPLYDLNHVRLLGTNLWNREELVEHKNRDIERAIFVDSLAPSDGPAANSNFVANYRAAFGEEPGVFELQAYDSALILRHLIANGETTRMGVARQLTELKNFPGALGSLSSMPNREIKRPMVGLTVRDGKIIPLDDGAKNP